MLNTLTKVEDAIIQKERHYGWVFDKYPAEDEGDDGKSRVKNEKDLV